ncbi:MAG: carboxypeptidase-like regulatory domain-containing protein, partial [Vicinamibacterales bacterium]
MGPSSSPRRIPIPFLAVLALLAAAPAAGQISTATIQGRVTDNTGVLPGATISAREVSSGFSQEAVSNADGSFT